MSRLITLIVLVTLSVLTAPPAIAETTISYQGQLQDGGGPVDASVDMTFELFDAASGGASVGGPLTESGVTVTDGLFQVELDFGEQPYFNGLWLAVEVEGDLLAPRQPITGAPFAISAAPGSGSNWEVNAADIYYSDGKVGIGTSSPSVALDVIGSAKFGYSLNQVSGVNSFATGGDESIGVNHAAGDWSFVGGGQDNTTTGSMSFIGGGGENIANGFQSFIGGGQINSTEGALSFVGGGGGNTASGSMSFVAGGSSNNAGGMRSFSAGYRANAGHDGSFVWGDNTNSAFESSGVNQFLIRAGGGVGVNTETPANSLTVAGDADFTGSVGIGTDSPDAALDVFGSAQFGAAHQASGTYSFIGGGQANIANGVFGFVGGGSDNTAGGTYSFVGGGFLNTASGAASFAAGSRANALHDGAFVWADRDNASFESTGENQFLIRAGGGVGISTDSPTRDLHIKQGSTDNGSIGLQIERSGASTNNWAFYIATSDNLGFRYNDNLVARIDTSGEFTTLSDARHKTDIGPIENPLTRLLALEPAQYRMRAGATDSQPSLGLIAQQVRDVIPSAVSDSEDTLGIRYNQITALNTAAIIELHAAMQDDRDRIAELEAENEDLKSQLAAGSARNSEIQSVAEHNESLERRVLALESLLVGEARLSEQSSGEVAP